MPLDLLLASNSTQHGRRPLEHCLDAVGDLFAGARRVGFVGFAKAELDAYAAWAQEALDPLGLEVVPVHTDPDPSSLDGVFVGGGNTFLLVKRLHESGWLGRIQELVRGGLPYLGASAGTNVATPTLCTTNDMPIVQPPSFAALGLVPFQINPHYLDPDPTSTHKGETREQRIAEYHQHNERVVVGLREGTWLRVTGSRMHLVGPVGARILRRGEEPTEVPAGADLSSLLG
ncbi:MAG: dipeptidase PepE [Alphaproteobacteria bacterium]|nr:dipeptidase PepE [Alphaproteobacteria bacterium]MCB9692467.1 dipeptidase PepE [Alphaproteobacteria bacterium]